MKNINMIEKYFFLSINYLAFAYAYFKIITKEIDNHDINISAYVIMSIIASGQIIKYRLFFKENNINIKIFMMLIYFFVALLFIFLFQFYSYYFINYIWWFIFFAALIVFAEFQYYFLTVKQLEELKFNIFSKNKKDQTESKSDTDEPQTK